MTDLLSYTFFRYALVAVLLISAASAMIGTYIVSRRLVAISGGVTHACFGGLGLGYFLGLNPIVMAGVAAIASSLGVEWMARRQRVREDSAIAVVWAAGMALGVLFVFLTPGYVPELNSFLFGNILTVTAADLWAFGIFTAVTAGAFLCFGNKIVVCAFDRDFARVQGLPVAFISTMMTVLTSLCIVLTIRLVGIMLLMSMFSLPQMAAEVWVHRFKPMMMLSMAISVACCVSGLLLATVIDVPCSALIVLVMICVYALSRLLFALIGGKPQY